MDCKVIDNIKRNINYKKNFVLNGGAGCGKTTALQKTVDYIFFHDPQASVACITYTNAAVKVIKQRCPYEHLDVSTIHDFLWSNIKTYQKNLKESIVDLVNQDPQGIKYSENLDLDSLQDKQIQYKEYTIINEGIISHDEVLTIANHMFGKYLLLSDIVKDKYNYILIDEYQDTHTSVIEIFLEHLQSNKKKSNIIAFFGDPMQAIYEKRATHLRSYIDTGIIEEIVKEDNYRCSVQVIRLLNNIRQDIKQKPSGDNKEGSVKFLYSESDNINIDTLKQHECFKNWNFSNGLVTKELYLTHKLISKKAGFDKIFEAYYDDEIIKHLQKIRKKERADNLQQNLDSKTFGEILDSNLVTPNARFSTFINNHPALYQIARNQPYRTFKKTRIDKDKLLGNETDKDKLQKHLYKIQRCIHLYETKQYNAFIRETEYSINSVADKKELADSINRLKEQKNQKIENILKDAHELGICTINEDLKEFIESKPYLYHKVKELEYAQIVSLYCFEEEYTPYSTQHGIKGDEFDNVLVVLDNGGWNQYNFKYLFEGTSNKKSVIERTLKIFYVCCSRAKENLVVFYHQPSQAIINKAKEWFGHDNIINLDSLLE